jgi:hypothetical protein
MVVVAGRTLTYFYAVNDVSVHRVLATYKCDINMLLFHAFCHISTFVRLLVLLLQIYVTLTILFEPFSLLADIT